MSKRRESRTNRRHQSFPPHLTDGLDTKVFDTISRDTRKTSRQKLIYADLNDRLARAWKDDTGLDLDRSPPLDVLDIGHGPGYFLYVRQSGEPISQREATPAAKASSICRRYVAGSARMSDA